MLLEITKKAPEKVARLLPAAPVELPPTVELRNTEVHNRWNLWIR